MINPMMKTITNIRAFKTLSDNFLKNRVSIYLPKIEATAIGMAIGIVDIFEDQSKSQ